MATVQQVLGAVKTTENGDIAFNSTLNPMLDILFLSEYYTNHLDQVYIGNTEREKLFAMFIRDPRFGLGRRDLGRRLMSLAEVSPEGIVRAGRYDDLIPCLGHGAYPFLSKEIAAGNELAKKWAPRYSSKSLLQARDFARYLGLNKQQYGKLVKAKTVERCLSSKNTGIIQFEHVPSLAMVKYYDRFKRGLDTKKRFETYIEDVKAGKKDLKVSTTSVYDIYRNCAKIDADIFFGKIEKPELNCLAVVDTSGSMAEKEANDALGKALAIGHYIGKCSTYMKDCCVTFSSNPEIRYFGEKPVYPSYYDEYYSEMFDNIPAWNADSVYAREIRSMFSGECSNTDFGKVMELLSGFGHLPDFIVVLSDMEFDMGSRMKKNAVKRLWKEKGYNTKIVWWNLNAHNATVPEIDEEGNIFMSGYNPILLKFLEAGFDGQKFLDKLLDEYEKKITQ